MSAYLSAPVREQVRRRAGQQCEYCHSVEWLTGQRYEIDHILPRQRDGASTLDNLCLACPSCNRYKQALVEAIDPAHGERVSLYHPRLQRWSEHFRWNDDTTQIVGITPTGRATVGALMMNNSIVVAARSFWSNTGEHPPQQE